ncbi:MAG: hypothetical protein AMXMBFR12_00470 [Candidatus Babeliales bacterium]
MNNKPFAEIMESSLQTFVAQCWEWDKMAQFGSLVTVEDGKRTIFALVYQIQTGSMDPVRYPFPYKKTHEELLAEQPQIFEFLKTTFNCISLGYQEKSRVYHLMPTEPPKIHSFVGLASTEQYREFMAKNGYLPLLFAFCGPLGNLDELLLAILRNQALLGSGLKPEKMAEFIETYSLLTGNDYRRLKLFLQRAQTLH